MSNRFLKQKKPLFLQTGFKKHFYKVTRRTQIYIRHLLQ